MTQVKTDTIVVMEMTLDEAFWLKQLMAHTHTKRHMTETEHHDYTCQRVSIYDSLKLGLQCHVKVNL
ncbi:MAG: hypothetical protein COA78_28390 [Blastopirellula sp.]|nr:MAG: hypothetical protein COA78_28390 [Blastopirellula sp.]